jgi:arylsulfatase A-like enzyme
LVKAVATSKKVRSLADKPKRAQKPRLHPPAVQACLGSCLALGLAVSIRAEDRPNFIVILTDDQGYADLRAHGVRDDVKTPNLDRLAREGVLFTDGYITAPQCSPSRAGLLTGRYEQRFGFDSINEGPLPLGQSTIADRLSAAGYATGMVGKWHLEPNHLCVAWAERQEPPLEMLRPGVVRLPRNLALAYGPGPRGFRDFYWGELNRYWRNFDLEGCSLAPTGEVHAANNHRIKEQTEAALAFLRRQNAPDPFFLYLAYYAPHVPLSAPEEYFSRFPGDMPERRRTALAMIAAVDDGVGRILDQLEDKKIRENTLVFFASDNGAPLGAQEGAPMRDVLPVDKSGPTWNGSHNDPLAGEKGMLSEGGIRVPFLASWPDRIAPGTVWRKPVIALDIAAVINAAAGLPPDPALDGIDFLPLLAAGEDKAPARDLFWRFWSQAAVRSGDWKYLRAGQDRKMLFNLAYDRSERKNVIAEHPDIAAELEAKLAAWAGELSPPGLPDRPLNGQEQGWYSFYFGHQTPR